eukprot:scaffold215143_cov26-Cyclotella_meneghiniana.AAC.1
MALTAEEKARRKAEKDAVCPSQFTRNGFVFNRQIINQKTVQYNCNNYRSGCPVKIYYDRVERSIDPIGRYDPSTERERGLHRRDCCVKNNLDPDDENVLWDRNAEPPVEVPMKSNPFFGLDDGVTLPPLVVDSSADYCVGAPTRSSFGSSTEEPQTARTSLSADSLESPRKTRIVQRAVDVTEDMKRRTKELAVGNWMLLPDKIWDTVKTEMTSKYGVWTGLHRDQVTKLVKNTRAEMGGDDMLKILEKDQNLHNLPSNGLPFLQFHGSLPHPEKKDEWM